MTDRRQPNAGNRWNGATKDEKHKKAKPGELIYLDIRQLRERRNPSSSPTGLSPILRQKKNPGSLG